MRPDPGLRPDLSATSALGVVLSIAALAGAGLAGGSCNDDTTACAEEQDARGCFDYACVEEGPSRSFQSDVLPILENSCSLSASCHGDPSSPDPSSGYRPYLGEVDQAATPSDVARIRSLIVGQSSHAAPSMAIVDPGKPESSFLMHKIDGDLACADVSCATDCGTTMPQSSDLLPRETRDIIRDWIRQGAPDN